MNQIIIAYHARCRGEIVLNEELAEYILVPPAKLRPWPAATGLAVRDWMLRRGLARAGVGRAAAESARSSEHDASGRADEPRSGDLPSAACGRPSSAFGGRRFAFPPYDPRRPISGSLMPWRPVLQAAGDAARVAGRLRTR